MKKFFSKFNIFLSGFLLVGVAFSIVTVVNAVTPNPGHPWSETGDGIFAVTGPTALRTFTFPDSDASIAILGANTFTATQTINSSSSYGLIVNTGNVGIATAGPDRKLDVLDAAAPQLRLTSTDGSVYGEIYGDPSGDIRLSSSGGSGIYAGIQNVRINEGNLWACAGGACGTAVTTTHPVVTNGNIIVENAVILDNNFQLKQTGATTVDMLDSGGNVILEFDESSL